MKQCSAVGSVAELDNRRQLLLTGGVAGSEESIEARYTLRDTSGREQTTTLGRLALVSYDRSQLDLKVVPVNGATVPADLAQQLNTIYRQAVAEFRVEVLPNLEVKELSGNVTFSNADNAFLRRYTSHMNKVIRTFKRTYDLDDDTYYLFLIPNPTTDPRQGYMPIKSQCGFVFLNNVSAEGVARVAAHELGHGAFRLYHTFSSDNRYVLPERSTDNLMDYAGTQATKLYKYQWDYIHDPQTMLFAWAEEEEEGAMGILCFNQLESIVEKIRKANIDRKNEIELQLFSCSEDYQYNKVKFGKKEYSGVKLSIKGYSGAYLDKDNNNQIPSYNIKPSELCKQSYSDKGIKFVKYQFHELKYDIKNAPYDKKEPTGEVRIEISIMENEAKNFEDYLYAQETIEIEGIPYLSQLDKEDTKNKTGCETGCCWAASCWMINQTSTTINHNSRIYFADPINVDNLADGITTIITEQEFNEAVLYVKNQLQLGRPVLCGTWDNRTKQAYENSKLGPEAWNDKLSGSNNSATTHFVVIMGYGYDKSQDKYYFRFYDPGRSDLSQGTSENNKFYIDEINLEITNNSYRGKIYKVTEIRKNF